MNPKDPHIFEMNINVINSLCAELDYLASPTIEEGMVCSLDCCIGNSRSRETFINCVEKYEEMRFIVGDEGLQLVRQLEEMLDEIYCCDDEEGFSKTERWLDFVAFVNKVNVFLKNAVIQAELTMDKKTDEKH